MVKPVRDVIAFVKRGCASSNLLYFDQSPLPPCTCKSTYTIKFRVSEVSRIFAELFIICARNVVRMRKRSHKNERGKDKKTQTLHDLNCRNYKNSQIIIESMEYKE